MRDFVWPRGGWARAFEYVKHRVQRLPDTPERISRGIWAGVFAAFTPFYGFHFVIAALLSLGMRGNVLASLMATFFGNPLTYIPIGVISLGTGYALLGMPIDLHIIRGGPNHCGMGCRFSNAFSDLWHNFMAIFTDRKPEWQGLLEFWNEIFWPYLVGGIIPGIFFATICYYTFLPLIRAYQKRRRNRLRKKMGQLRENSAETDGAGGPKV